MARKWNTCSEGVYIDPRDEKKSCADFTTERNREVLEAKTEEYIYYRRIFASGVWMLGRPRSFLLLEILPTLVFILSSL